MTEKIYSKIEDLKGLIMIDQKAAWIHKDVRNVIVELIKYQVEEYGSCRVGWAAKEVIGIDQQNHVHDKIMGITTKSGLYTKERNMQFEKDWNIYYNPNYELGEITKRTSFVQRRVLIITVIVSALTLITQGVNIGITLSNQEKQKDLQKQLDNLPVPNITIDSVVVHQSSKEVPKKAD